jgi:hypothetical protein
MPRPALPGKLAAMSTLIPAKPCSGSRGPAAEERPDNDTGICPACGQILHLGYAGLLPSHPTKPAASPQST